MVLSSENILCTSTVNVNLSLAILFQHCLNSINMLCSCFDTKYLLIRGFIVVFDFASSDNTDHSRTDFQLMKPLPRASVQ